MVPFPPLHFIQGHFQYLANLGRSIKGRAIWLNSTSFQSDCTHKLQNLCLKNTAIKEHNSDIYSSSYLQNAMAASSQKQWETFVEIRNGSQS